MITFTQPENRRALAKMVAGAALMCAGAFLVVVLPGSQLQWSAHKKLIAACKSAKGCVWVGITPVTASEQSVTTEVEFQITKEAGAATKQHLKEFALSLATDPLAVRVNFTSVSTKGAKQ